MLVSAGNLRHHGRILDRGEPIADIKNWSPYIIRLHVERGAMLDVTEEQAADLKKEGEAAKVLAAYQRLLRAQKKAATKSRQAAAEIERLNALVRAAEEEQEAAEKDEFATQDAVQSFLADHPGVDEAESERLAALAARKVHPQAPEPKDDTETSSESPLAVPTPQELRAKAIGALGGYSKGELVKKVKAAWGVDPAELLPDGVKSTKGHLQLVAYTIYEAMFMASAAGVDTKSEARGEIIENARKSVYGGFGATIEDAASGEDSVEPDDAE